MKRFKFSTLCMLSLLSLSLAFGEELRTWTSSSGSKLKASLVSAQNGSVILKRENGKEITLKLNQLSKEDQTFIQESMSSNEGDSDSTEKNAETKSSSDTLKIQYVNREGKVDVIEVPKRKKEWDNYDAPWPYEGKSEFANIEITVIQESEGKYVYESPHFKFVSDAPLNPKVVKTVAINFEATFDICSKLPLALPCRDLINDPKAKKYVINLYEDRATYARHGGPGNSAGYFLFPEVHVPFESMGLRKRGDVYLLDGQGDGRTLIHEVVHQMTIVPGVTCYPHWFTEGIAEYISISSNKNGLINLRTARQAIMVAVTETGKRNQGGRALGNECSLKSLKRFMNVPYEQFTGADASFFYGFSSILFYYYCHLDGKGNAKRLIDFVKNLNETPIPPEQLGERDPKIDYAYFLNGQSWEEFEKETAMGVSKMKFKLKINPEMSRLFELTNKPTNVIFKN